MNSNRQNADGETVANRRVFYDFTISPPKSVSVVAFLADDRILQIHDQALKVAMTELEKFAESRLRKSGERGERQTGNIVAAAFRHDTSRELDPHLQTPPYADGDISEGVSALHTTVSTRKFDRRVTGLRPWRECTHGDQEGNLQVREAG